MEYFRLSLKLTVILFVVLTVVSVKAGNDFITLEDIESIEASSVGYGNNAEKSMDGDGQTRWESVHAIDPVWLKIKFKKKVKLFSIMIRWETASAKVYKLQISQDGSSWNNISRISDGGEGEERTIEFKTVNTEYFRILCEQRTTKWGYSIWEIEFNTAEETNLPSYNPDNLYTKSDIPVEERIEDLLSRMSLREKVDMITGQEFMTTRPNKRLKIPELKMTDGPHGVGTGHRSTCFPTGISLASTWDKTLVYNVGIALGEETLGHGRHILLGPCVNIHRTPLGGRNFESMSEDPYLTSRLAVAYIKGVQSTGAGVSVKHFACNNQEWERFTTSVEIDERTLREIYLPHFKAAITEAGALTVMASYNKINGFWSCENKYLLTDILKNEWGFKGFVVSDWWAVKSIVPSANAGCDLEMPGPAKYMTAKNILPEIKKGNISVETINDKVRRILRVEFKLGLFDEPDLKYKGAVDTPEHRKLAREAAENAIVLLKNDNKVLPLKEDSIKSIAVIGSNALEARLGGGGSSTVHPNYSVSPLEGIKRKVGNNVDIYFSQGCNMVGNMDDIPEQLLSPAGYSEDRTGLKGEYYSNTEFKGDPVLVRVDKKINFKWGGDSPDPKLSRDNFSVRWTGYFTPDETREYTLGITSDDGSRLFINNKILINNWGDHGDVNKKGSIRLEAGKRYEIRIEYYEKGGGATMILGWESSHSLLNKAVETAKKADVAVVFAGLSAQIEGEGVDKKDLNLPEGQDELINAVIKANKNTIVVLINGTPVLMDKWVDKVPALIEAWYPGQEGGNAIANILFGDVNPSGKIPSTFPHKYEDAASSSNYPGENGKVYYKEGIFVGYRHYDREDIEPLFCFGHGLSYTDFKYSDIQVKLPDGERYPVKVSMNIENSGKYKGKETIQLYVKDIESRLERPVKELKSFKKVDLSPGESREVEFKLEKSAFAYFDPDKKRWIVEPGKFEVLIGSSSRDIRLRKTFEIE